ncbi:hypothetical protein GCM10023144_25110 [Pigmentiphaga soli]|uniref:Serine acetyltransferase n=2 Tax=Pigmentiphaga soli TaxID=1007095 RepID=A0ABP8H2X8_9BURK
MHACVNIGGQAGFYAPEDAINLAPRIGDNSYIGPGAKIFGAIQIGNNCAIGANAVVNKSYSDHGLLLIGIPARPVDRKSNNEN